METANKSVVVLWKGAKFRCSEDEEVSEVIAKILAADPEDGAAISLRRATTRTDAPAPTVREFGHALKVLTLLWESPRRSLPSNVIARRLNITGQHLARVSLAIGRLASDKKMEKTDIFTARRDGKHPRYWKGGRRLKVAINALERLLRDAKHSEEAA